MYRISIIIFIIFFTVSGFSQSDSTKIISREEIENLFKSITSYEVGIKLADSLYYDYQRDPFSTRDNSGTVADGIIFIRDFYVYSCRLKYDEYCNTMVEVIMKEYPFTDPYFEMNKKVQVADEYFLNGDYERAIELYNTVRNCPCVDPAVIDEKIKISQKNLKEQKKK